ncbi:GrdX family protein [[Clostridium] symbiosum]|uniref:GrdX family protein n=1 Tax=Clostridium symbiosum TaxID=1512 RepID=UPI001FA6B29E|nr:GrdX family protein [[Clostridium] symbiosum]
MNKLYTLITNNELVKERYGAYGKVLNVEYLEDAGCLDVLIKARDAIHGGSRLETHPMAGSIKPNQNPYKTVMISDGKVDPEEFQEFITVMENSIMTCRKFLMEKPLPEWNEKLKKDFRYIDQSLIESAVSRI